MKRSAADLYSLLCVVLGFYHKTCSSALFPL